MQKPTYLTQEMMDALDLAYADLLKHNLPTRKAALGILIVHTCYWLSVDQIRSVVNFWCQTRKLRLPV